MAAIIILTFITVIVIILGKSVGNSKNTQVNKTISNKKIDMLIDFATLMTKHLQNNLQLDSPLIFYEQVFLLYFLKDMKAIGEKIPEASRSSELHDLILTLESKHKLDYLVNKDDFKNTFSKRYADYINLLSHDEFNFSDSFFNDLFEYQTAQIISIKDKKQFTTFNPILTCLSNSKEELRIKSIVSDNFSLIDAFMAQQ